MQKLQRDDWPVDQTVACNIVQREVAMTTALR